MLPKFGRSSWFVISLRSYTSLMFDTVFANLLCTDQNKSFTVTYCGIEWKDAFQQLQNSKAIISLFFFFSLQHHLKSFCFIFNHSHIFQKIHLILKKANDYYTKDSSFCFFFLFPLSPLEKHYLEGLCNSKLLFFY